MSTKRGPKTDSQITVNNTEQKKEVKDGETQAEEAQVEPEKVEKPKRVRKPRVKKTEQTEIVTEQPVAEPPAPVVEDGVVVEDGDDEDEQETQAEEAAEEAKVGRPLTRQEKQDMRRARQQRRKAARERNRQQREKDNEDYHKASEPDYPKAVGCFFHPEEVLVVSDQLGENQAFSPNGIVVIAMSEIHLSQGDKRGTVVQLMKKLKPGYFNKDQQPPAICMPVLGKIETGMKLLRPLLNRENPALREPLSFTYKDGYIKWARWAGKREKEMVEGSWAVWDKIMAEHHPEFKDERNAETLAGKLSQECMDALRVELMEKSRKYRGSEAWQLLKNIHEINRETWERQQIAEMEQRAKEAAGKKAEYVEGVVDDLADLIELAPETAPSEEHKEHEATIEWLRRLIGGKLNTAEISRSWGDLERFRADPGLMVKSDNPNNSEEGTQLTTYGRENKPLFRTAIVPVRVVDKEGRLKKAEGGGKFWVPRLVVLTAWEAWQAMELRKQLIVEKLKSDSSLTPEQAAELYEMSQDQHDSWRDGSLAIGKLWTMTLKMRIEKYMAKNPDGPQVRSAIQKRNPRGTHGNEGGSGQSNEATPDETAAWLNGQPVEQISAKPRLKGNGG